MRLMFKILIISINYEYHNFLLYQLSTHANFLHNNNIYNNSELTSAAPCLIIVG